MIEMIMIIINKFLGVTLPIAYIWSTPLLATTGFCRQGADELLGHSVSRFISTPQATGMMAVCYFSIANIMISKRYLAVFVNNSEIQNTSESLDHKLFHETKPSWKRTIFIGTGYIYEIFFASFLCAPCISVPTIHAISVISFSLSAYVHTVLLLHNTNLKKHWTYSLRLLNGCGTVAMLGMAGCQTITTYNTKLPIFLFWFFECMGLSSFVLFMHFAQLALPKNNPSEISNPLL
tara:strand:+ start:882 stop:1586 length:705 start_codon:yes stop_codon:yes gene_type:complete